MQVLGTYRTDRQFYENIKLTYIIQETLEITNAISMYWDFIGFH
jgi:hypothetical protein